MKKFLLVMMLVSTAALADAPAPVEISAAKSLEWNRAAKTYTAREKAMVVQGTAKMESDILTAHYDDASGATNITTIEADNHVVVSSDPYKAYGDKAVYTVKTGTAVLTGHDLRITTDTDTLTARDKVEFFSAENRLTAVGNVTVLHDEKTMTADKMDAFFSKDAQGKMSARKITAHGNVTIKTDKETLTGDEGVYDVPAQKAVLTGKVHIRQGENWLEGTRANVDMKTGMSELLNEGGDSDGRVRGVFYPKSEPQIAPVAPVAPVTAPPAALPQEITVPAPKVESPKVEH